MYFFQLVGDNKWEKMGAPHKCPPMEHFFPFCCIEIIPCMFMSTFVPFSIYSVNKEGRFQFSYLLTISVISSAEGFH